jgi:TolB-like protein
VANGLTDLLITDLGQRRPLSVLARTSSREFVGSRRMLDLARDLGVTHIVEGSVQSGEESGQLHVSVRLLRAGTGTLLSTRTFNTSTARLAALAHDAGDTLASALHASTNRPAAAQIAIDAEAMEAYFRGWNEYWRLTRDGFVEAERLFKVTTTRAPDYAPGFAALAYVTLQLEKSYKAFPPGVGVAAALRSAETAVSLDSENAQAQAALGWTRFYGEWKWRDGETALLRSIELNPSDAQARWMYGQLLAAQNRLDAALEEARLAVRLDPLSPSRHSNVATILYYARRYEDAIKESQQILVRDPNAIVGHFGMARFLTALDRHDEAIVMLRSSANAKEPPVRAELVRILLTAGRTRDAEALLPALEEDYRAGRLAPDYYAFVVLAQGDAERALALLHQAVNERSPSVIWIQVDPRFDPLRSRPEFLDVLRLIGLAS